jgi:hypothetical protein
MGNLCSRELTFTAMTVAVAMLVSVSAFATTATQQSHVPNDQWLNAALIALVASVILLGVMVAFLFFRLYLFFRRRNARIEASPEETSEQSEGETIYSPSFPIGAATYPPLARSVFLQLLSGFVWYGSPIAILFVLTVFLMSSGFSWKQISMVWQFLTIGGPAISCAGAEATARVALANSNFPAEVFKTPISDEARAALFVLSDIATEDSTKNKLQCSATVALDNRIIQRNDPQYEFKGLSEGTADQSFKTFYAVGNLQVMNGLGEMHLFYSVTRLDAGGFRVVIDKLTR